tara:strand:+ start:3256 stop:4341 length:1086 start_codon:yes stop_codon:yes gene_type:complete
MLKPSSEFKIGNKTIGFDKPTFFIADIAANHDGDISRAKELIYQAAEAGADAAKFQHFQAKTIVSQGGFEALGGKLSHQSKWEKSIYEVYKDASVSLEWTNELISACKEVQIPFFTTPYSLEVIQYIDEYVPAYKIGSGDINWTKIIKTVAQKNKPYIIASGASTLIEVTNAVRAGLEFNPNLCLMQCNTNYTASLENFKYINLNVLKTYSSMFKGLILGLSDHTPGHSTVLGAISLGARMIEKHFTDDNDRDGPDHPFSMNPKSWKEMVMRSRELELALGSGIKEVELNEKETVIVQRRSIFSNKNIKKGDIIKEEDLKIVRPAPDNSYEPDQMDTIIGMKAAKDIMADKCIVLGELTID